MTTNPLEKFKRLMREARRAGIELPEAMALATSDERGRPSVRFMLLKEATEKGFVFYTNTLSPKGRDMLANPWAALAFYWHETGRQVRVEGKLFALSASDADEYWSQRPRGSQLASAVSLQSAALDSYGDLVAAYRELERTRQGGSVPRPDHWKGFRVRPDRIEFWTRREPRLHLRESYQKRRGRWYATLLQP
ncbi:MAG: pyridoxamine 5'-phosphate oxidase [Candidatus Binatia bacterium]